MMRTFKLLKCWPNADPNTCTVDDAVPYFDSVKNLIYGIDYVTKPDEDSFFDLVFTGPDAQVCNSKSVKQGKMGEFDSHSKSHSPVSGIKFRVFFFGFRKSNPEKAGIDDPKQRNTKTNSLRGRSKLKKEREEELSVDDSWSSKQFARAAELAKFLKLIKYRNTKMCTHKLRLSVMKSRSTAASFAGVSSSLPPMNRRDDSLLEQNDGIQSAILHCKRSYSTASKDCSMLLPRASYYEEESRWSI